MNLKLINSSCEQEEKEDIVIYSIKRVRKAHIQHLNMFHQQAQHTFSFLETQNSDMNYQIQKTLILELFYLWLNNLKDFLMVGGNKVCCGKKKILKADFRCILSLFEETATQELFPIILKYMPKDFIHRLSVTKEDYFELYIALLSFWEMLPAYITVDYRHFPVFFGKEFS